MTWGEVYPRIIYGVKIQHYSDKIFNDYSIGYEWVQKNWNCGEIVAGISCELEKDGQLNDGQIKIEEKQKQDLLKFFESNQKYKADIDTLGYYLCVYGYDADQEEGILIEDSDSEDENNSSGFNSDESQEN